MALHVALNHRTSYRYDRLTGMGPQVVRLRPAPHCRTPIVSYALKIEPKGYFLNWQQDPFGNFLARVVYPEKIMEFHVEVDLVADMVIHNPFDFFLEPEAERYPFAYEPLLQSDLDPYLEVPAQGPRLKAWLQAFAEPEDQPTVDFLVAVNRKLQSDIGYVIRLEPGVQSAEETLESGRGSCRDSSWLLVQILRHFGLAARFVSGYLIQLVADVKSLDGPSGADRDFTDLHAWVEVYLPGAGWVGLDPTSGLFAGEGHIPLACTPHPATAAPISGNLEYAETEFGHEMSVRRILESPRVTKPYSEETWADIDAFGRRLDRELADGDVRLTMGGEPTFVSIDFPDAPEWNIAAVGPTKRARAVDLIKRLRKRFAPHGLLHFGQGKWYPGEQLPRWAFSLYWRRDSQPLWNEEALIADEAPKAAIGPKEAEAFARGIAARMEVDEGAVLAAYEDPWHFIEQERKLPENLDPATNKLDDPQARQRLAKVFERGLGTPTGYVLPLQRWNARDGGGRWMSEPWTTRAKHLFLIPGDSPVGFRLPIDTLPHVEPGEYPYIQPADPFEERAPLPEPDRRRQPFLRSRGGQSAAPQAPQTLVGQELPDREGKKIVRSALSVEPREGRICVFMPPVETLEDYLELVTALEDTAAELDVPIHLEGYLPPDDPRVNVIRVTPDPGVIEVNVHPAGDWSEMKAITEAIYEDAHHSRLGTEKFMLDGRHTGTGGGNHVVLGGPTPADSPFLRRPDLLASLVCYWQHHPALSYLFSGLFIGPTSQAPRVDEARHDSLYELELAFTQVPEPGAGQVPLWLVDRIFRNLLIDVSGNTHRSEICIDKLYSPDGPTGRLGLVEFRAFEMPPHARMSLAQQLLLRALVARFWKTPYRGKPVRWGTALHDRFMLPHFVRADFQDVIDDLNRAGYPMRIEWFAPHLEFRFPVYGEIRHDTIGLEIRQALEPWHVMGEEGAPGGTVRFVDASVERLQVKVTGLAGERYEVACNGCRVPLTATGVQGEYVGGIRYRAWKPSSSLHPTIEVDAPLTIDLYDRWSGRAVAGCVYHVAHPGGRNYEQFPVNAYEAESRRLARFFAFGHTTGASPAPRDLGRPEFPHTLDLRWS
ncbi:transglutaminase family protein [Oceanibacterium hippocampi]|uniref:Transglutaminase-like superfamily protein n=1 Tax=Oceanibacterium hippocampi TaxID=745714 RepID=A0A1Y5TDA9_9PROT|nr:transglutaminase family protein [Oceanibacterium hippocampi]SLN61415.1 Transglutaminase-like superfamily protein [Oceanibacterium hippocampi]